MVVGDELMSDKTRVWWDGNPVQFIRWTEKGLVFNWDDPRETAIHMPRGAVMRLMAKGVLEIEGEQKHYSLGGQIGGSYKRSEQARVRIWPTPNGMYAVLGSINGYPVDFIVDTGASVTVISLATARAGGVAPAAGAAVRAEGAMGRLADLVHKLSDSVADFKLPQSEGSERDA